MADFNKNFLIETVTSIFNDSVYSEAKLNIAELHEFFDPYGVTYKTLLDLISRYDSSKISRLIVTDALIHEANRTEEEANFVVNKITESRKFNAETVDKIKQRIRKLCYQSYVDKCAKTAGDDIEKFQRLVASYSYKDLGSSEFKILNLRDCDATTLTEKYLSHPIPSRFQLINKAFAGKKGYHKGSLGLVCGRPKSGKSLFMMSEAVNFAERGFKVFYIALGDLNELDFITRMSAISTRTPFDVVYSDVEKYHKILLKSIDDGGGEVLFACVPSGKLTPDEFKNIVLNRLGDRDVILIDYDLNFKLESDNMYERGGYLYDLLTEVKMETGALILAATQPSKSFWSEPLLDDTCFIESSKKSMIVDFAITIGVEPESGTHLGYVNMPINRRGGTISFPYIRANCGELLLVPGSVYGMYAHDPIKRDLSYKEIVKLAEMSPQNG